MKEASVTVVGTSEGGVKILEIRCAECGRIITVTGVPSKVEGAIARHAKYVHGEDEGR